MENNGWTLRKLLIMHDEEKELQDMDLMYFIEKFFNEMEEPSRQFCIDYAISLNELLIKLDKDI